MADTKRSTILRGKMIRIEDAVWINDTAFSVPSVQT